MGSHLEMLHQQLRQLDRLVQARKMKFQEAYCVIFSDYANLFDLLKLIPIVLNEYKYSATFYKCLRAEIKRLERETVA